MKKLLTVAQILAMFSGLVFFIFYIIIKVIEDPIQPAIYPQQEFLLPPKPLPKIPVFRGVKSREIVEVQELSEFEKCSGAVKESDGFAIVTKFTHYQSWDEIDEACSHLK